MKAEGEIVFSIPGWALLVFALLIWLVFFLILLSSPKNQKNRWCFVCGLIFGLGVFKEYLYYELGPELIERGLWSIRFSQLLYSWQSALFYYLAMPSALMFCLYFCNIDRRAPEWFRIACVMAFVPAVIFSICYPCPKVLSFQQEPAFCLAVAGYDWAYGLAGSALIIRTLWQERQTEQFRQRFMEAAGLMIPLFCWLTLAFPRQALGKGVAFSKLWQGNIVVVDILLIWLVFQLFHGGIWGMPFRREHYDSDRRAEIIRDNAGYVAHALKNELVKIEWGLSLLKERKVEGDELEVIAHSADYLKNFIRETQIYSDIISILPEDCRVQDPFEEAVRVLDYRKKIQVCVIRCDAAPLYCDRIHVTEVLRNLLLNAAEASEENGRIELSYRCSEGLLGSGACIQVRDYGRGMPEEELAKIFNPYYTTKSEGKNMGLGLYYCRNVMTAHKGRIEAKIFSGGGSAFILWFPVKKKRGFLPLPGRNRKV